jgi:hypothetical protein
VVAPPVSVSATKLSTSAFSQGNNAQDTVVSFTRAADLTLSGRLNRIWLSAAQAGGNVAVSGDLNTVVFMAGVDTKVSVTGTGNTFYLPLGTSIQIEGAGLESSTVRYY